jgi:hypothetical protein
MGVAAKAQRPFAPQRAQLKALDVSGIRHQIGGGRWEIAGAQRVEIDDPGGDVFIAPHPVHLDRVGQTVCVADAIIGQIGIIADRFSVKGQPIAAR